MADSSPLRGRWKQQQQLLAGWLLQYYSTYIYTPPLFTDKSEGKTDHRPIPLEGKMLLAKAPNIVS